VQLERELVFEAGLLERQVRLEAVELLSHAAVITRVAERVAHQVSEEQGIQIDSRGS
jgi:hypothetical protein